MDQQGIVKQAQKILVDLIMIVVYVKIGMTLDIVCSVIVVFICMIDQTIKLAGNKKKILKELKEKGGRGLITQRLKKMSI